VYKIVTEMQIAESALAAVIINALLIWCVIEGKKPLATIAMLTKSALTGFVRIIVVIKSGLIHFRMVSLIG